jgi:phosphoglycolate phosphatase-like HAD superfamily hydrolase
MQVVLFDIDGTLVSSSIAEHDEKRRYVNAIRDVVGKEPCVVPSRFAGMVDPQICKILLNEIGLSEDKVEYFLPKVIARMGELYRGMEKKLVLNNGVEDLLRFLARSANHVVGVLTGNLLEVGTEKLSVAGIRSNFSEGFYADEYLDRNRLTKDAVETCVAKYHLPSSRNVMMIGDTPIDIAAANTANATSIGVASGVFSVSQLLVSGATWVFRDLKPTKELLVALGLEQPKR